MVPLISRRRFGKAICALAVMAGTQRTGSAAEDKASVPSPHPDAKPIVYPQTKRDTVVETQFGVSVPDPYRWLEGEPRTDADVASWIDTQRRFTTQHLSHLPARDVFRRSLVSTFDYERVGIPQRSGGRYFFTRRAGARTSPCWSCVMLPAKSAFCLIPRHGRRMAPSRSRNGEHRGTGNA